MQATESRDTWGETSWTGPAVPPATATTKPPIEVNEIPPAITHALGLGQAMALR